MIFSAFLFVFYIVGWFLTFYTLESIYELRRCKKDNPSGGYYQKFNIAQLLAAKYLKNRCEIKIEKLPQGGYNVYPYTWIPKKTLLLPGESFKELE